MLVVTVEIWDGGNPRMNAKIGYLTAVNVSDLADISSYEVCIGQSGSERSGVPRLNEKFLLEDHRRSDGVWELVRRAAVEVLNRREGLADEPTG